MANFRVSGTNKGLRLDSGDKIRFLDYPTIGITEFSDDTTLAGDSSTALCTEHAIKTYVDAQVSSGSWYAGSTPPASPSTGDPWYNTNNEVVYAYDGSRWLSLTHHHMTLGYDGNADGDYLTTLGISAPVNDIGVFSFRDININAVCIRADDGNTNKGASFEIDYVWQEDFYIVNYLYHNETLDYDLDAGETFQIYIWGSGTTLKHPVARIEYRYRYTP